MPLVLPRLIAGDLNSYLQTPTLRWCLLISSYVGQLLIILQIAHLVQKLLSQPETWAQFSQEELDEIGTRFPENVPRNENGSISTDWLRYNNDWRNGVRLWQGDLEAGHLDPEWLKQAAQAMEDRAAGKFDKFKEDEYEKFWGQKQKMDYNMRAGKSAALKLDDLIAGSLFRENDFWIYCRGFGIGKNHIDVVKDCKVSLF